MGNSAIGFKMTTTTTTSHSESTTRTSGGITTSSSSSQTSTRRTTNGGTTESASIKMDLGDDQLQMSVSVSGNADQTSRARGSVPTQVVVLSGAPKNMEKIQSIAKQAVMAQGGDKPAEVTRNVTALKQIYALAAPGSEVQSNAQTFEMITGKGWFAVQGSRAALSAIASAPVSDFVTGSAKQQ